MRVLHQLTDDGFDEYRSELTGEKLGWVIFLSDQTFVPVHRVLMHPEDGPVLMIMSEVLEVDPDDENLELFASEEAARAAFYARPQPTLLERLRNGERR